MVFVAVEEGALGQEADVVRYRLDLVGHISCLVWDRGQQYQNKETHVRNDDGEFHHLDIDKPPIVIRAEHVGR